MAQTPTTMVPDHPQGNGRDHRIAVSDAVMAMRHAVADAGEHLLDTIRSHALSEPTAAIDRATAITVRPLPADEAESDVPVRGEWRPGGFFAYRSVDPWQQLNPHRSAAIAHLIAVGSDHAHIGRRDNDLGLAYADVDTGRSRFGTTANHLTDAIIAIDPGMGDWVRGLPRAEGLRPVAHPWSDVPMVVRRSDGTFAATEVSPAMLALAGGSGDGRGVRERAAWEAWMLRRLRSELNALIQRDGALMLTSLGTGTGEPIMDTGLQIMAEMFPRGEHSVQVHGFDLDPDSLAVAQHLAADKSAADDGRLAFHGEVRNLLGRDALAASIAATRPHVIEAIGFAEYVASAVPHSIGEAQQRASAQRAGRLSAEEFFGTIYQCMSAGSVLLTGNMRSDSPDVRFLIDALGWPGIIQRSTTQFLEILERAGIRGADVEVFIPEKGHSSGVYNLVAVTKMS